MRKFNSLYNYLAPRSAVMPWLYLVLSMLPLLGLQGCTQITARWEADNPDTMATKQSMMLKSVTATEGHDLWERLRQGFTLPKLTSNAVEIQALHIAANDRPEKVLARASSLLHLMMQEIQQHRLPMELVLVPLVESKFLPEAHSPVGADGAWQFMPATAREQGLAINRVHDDRRAWIKSTRAALDYLQKLHSRFGDWPIAMAAYNAGEGRVEQALRRHGQKSRFEKLASLPQESRQYVVKIFAWRSLLSTPERYDINLPQITDELQLEEVPISQDLDLALAARLSGLSQAHFRHLNPAFSGPVIAAATQPSLLLPKEAVHRFKLGLAERHARRQPLATWSLKRLDRAATAFELARQWQLDATTLVTANPLASGHRYQAGSMLFIPRRFQADQANAADIRYSTLSTEPIPRPAKVKKHARQNKNLPANIIWVKYRPTRPPKTSPYARRPNARAGQRAT